MFASDAEFRSTVDSLASDIVSARLAAYHPIADARRCNLVVRFAHDYAQTLTRSEREAIARLPLVAVSSPELLAELTAARVASMALDTADAIDSGEACFCCGGRFDELQASDSGESYCEECYSENFTECDDCGSETARDSVITEDGREYCEDCYSERFISCEDCGESIDTRRESTHDTPSGETLCWDCYSENYGECTGCGNICHRENLYYNERDCEEYCEYCLPSKAICEFSPRRFRPSVNTFDRIGSRRTFGVELETSEADGHDYLDGRCHFGAKEDGSVCGPEFYSDILAGDAGLAAVEEFCEEASDFSVDSTCGFHLHVGCQDLSDGELFAVASAYALTETVWQSFVPDSRRWNTACRSIDWGFADCRQAIAEGCTFASFASQQMRRRWCNISAYNRHSTIEIRLHTGTVNATKVCNWIMAHCRFVDAMAKLSLAEVHSLFSGSIDDKFAALADIIGDELAEYYRKRAAKFGTEYREVASLSCGLA